MDKKINQLDLSAEIDQVISAHSPSLIAWADLVINFGSSIGI